MNLYICTLKGGKAYSGKGEVDYRWGKVPDDAEGVLGRLGYKIVTDYTWLFKIILNQIENSIP